VKNLNDASLATPNDTLPIFNTEFDGNKRLSENNFHADEI